MLLCTHMATPLKKMVNLSPSNHSLPMNTQGRGDFIRGSPLMMECP